MLATNAYDTALTIPFEFNFTAYHPHHPGRGICRRPYTRGYWCGGLQRYGDAASATSTYLRLLAKIASVEARHAAFVRDQAEPNSFAGPEVIVASGAVAGLETL